MKECFRRTEFHQNMNIGAILKVPQELHHMPVVQLPVQCDLLLHLLLGTPLLLEHSLLYHLVRKQLPCPAVRHRVDLGKPPVPKSPPTRNTWSAFLSATLEGITRGRGPSGSLLLLLDGVIAITWLILAAEGGRKMQPQIQFEK